MPRSYTLESPTKFIFVDLQKLDNSSIVVFELEAQSPCNVKQSDFKPRAKIAPRLVYDTLEVSGVKITGDDLKRLAQNLLDWNLIVNYEGFCYFWTVRSADSSVSKNVEFYRVNEIFDWSVFRVAKPNRFGSKWNRCVLGKPGVVIDYEKMEEDWKKKLSDREKELSDKLEELIDCREKLSDKEKELAKKDKELNDVKGKLKENDKELNDTKNELKDCRKEMGEKEQELNDAKAKLKGFDDMKKELDEKKKELNDAKDKLKAKEKELNDTEGRLKEKGKELNATKNELKEYRKKLIEKEQELNDAKAKLKGFDDVKKELGEKEKELSDTKNELKDCRKKLSDKEQQLNDANAKLKGYEDGKELKEKEKELNDTRNKLREKEKELNDTKNQLKKAKDEIAKLKQKGSSGDDTNSNDTQLPPLVVKNRVQLPSRLFRVEPQTRDFAKFNPQTLKIEASYTPIDESVGMPYQSVKLFISEGDINTNNGRFDTQGWWVIRVKEISGTFAFYDGTWNPYNINGKIVRTPFYAGAIYSSDDWVIEPANIVGVGPRWTVYYYN